jgi:deoxyhypusine synthase
MERKYVDLEARPPVRDMDILSCNNLHDLMDLFSAAGGFSAKKLAEGADIFTAMMEDPECFVFLSLPACVISTGLRGVVRDLVKHRMVDAVITTCGLLDHDLARIWQDYYHGEFIMDERALHRDGVNRLGNVLVPNESYGEVLEARMQPVLAELFAEKETWSTRDLIWAFGDRIDDESSIVHWAARNRIPMFVPGITDGAFGCQLWMFTQEHRSFQVNLFEDEQALSDIVFTREKTGALMLGGGISKHHVIWWNQFKEGLDYAVYITTAVEYDGSLSGARIREAISWGKVREEARYVTVDGDMTVLLPLLVGSYVHGRGGFVRARPEDG